MIKMLPSKTLNIYPKSKENIDSLISYYLAKYDVSNSDSYEAIDKHPSLQLNQLEFIIKNIASAYPEVFRKNLNGIISVSNLLSYGIESLTQDEKDYKGSGPRIKIMKLFREFVTKSES